MGARESTRLAGGTQVTRSRKADLLLCAQRCLQVVCVVGCLGYAVTAVLAAAIGRQPGLGDAALWIGALLAAWEEIFRGRRAGL